MSLFDFFNLGREEPAEASAQVIAEESEAMAETEEVEMSSLSEINEPEESDTFRMMKNQNQRYRRPKQGPLILM